MMSKGSSHTRWDSIYRGHPLWATRVAALFGVGPTIKVNDQLIGSDKLGHFLSQGRKFYRQVPKIPGRSKGRRALRLYRAGAVWPDDHRRLLKRRPGGELRGVPVSTAACSKTTSFPASRLSWPGPVKAGRSSDHLPGPTTSTSTGTRRSTSTTSTACCTPT